VRIDIINVFGHQSRVLHGTLHSKHRTITVCWWGCYMMSIAYLENSKVFSAGIDIKKFVVWRGCDACKPNKLSEYKGKNNNKICRMWESKSNTE